jgi:hypothetical protein
MKLPLIVKKIFSLSLVGGDKLPSLPPILMAAHRFFVIQTQSLAPTDPS